MRRVLSKGWELLAPLSAIGLGLLAFLWNPVPVQIMRNAVFDQYQRWQPRDYKPAPVRIVDIDDESLRRLGQWPWPRSRIAALTARLQDAQPAVIAFDIVFAEPDRTSPKAMLGIWRLPEPARTQISQLPDPDEVLADVFGRGKVVLGFALDQRPPSQAPPLPGSLATSRYVTVGGPVSAFVHGFANAAGALPTLQARVQGNGALNFVPDSDGVVRRVPLLLGAGSTLLPSLSAEALRVAQGEKNYVLRSSAVPLLGLEDIRIGQRLVPTTPQGEVWVHFSRPVPERYIPAWKVLAADVPMQDLSGHIVLVGVSAQGLTDLRLGPMGNAMPGVEIHAQMLEQVLMGGGLTRPAWVMAIEALVMVAGGALVGGVALGGGAMLSFGLFAGMLAALWASAWWAFSGAGLLLDPALPTLVLLLTFVLASVLHHLRAERRQAWVKQAFSRYLSPNLSPT